MNYKAVLRFLIVSSLYVPTSFTVKKTTNLFDPSLLTDAELESAKSVELSREIKILLLSKKYCEYKKILVDEKIAGDPADPVILHVILKFMKDNECMGHCHSGNVRLAIGEYLSSLRIRRLEEFKERYGATLNAREVSAVFDATCSLERSERANFITTKMRRLGFSKHELAEIMQPGA